MQSKISFFHKTIFKKNLTRFWPFAAVYGLYLFLVHPMTLYLTFTDALRAGSEMEAWQVVGRHFTSVTEPVSVFLAAIVMAAAVFSYLYQSRSANMLHAFPVTRTQLFVTNYLSGLALMLIPQALAALASNLVILGKANDMTWSVWAWFGITVGETVFFYGFACLIAMFTGQLLASGLFYMIWNFLYAAVVALVNLLCALFIYGMDDSLIRTVRQPLFPLAYLLENVGFSMDSQNAYYVKGIPSLLVYVGAGLVFAALAWYAYQKRRIECAGDFLSIRWTAPVFRWGTALVGGVAGALCMTYLTGENVSRNQMVIKFIVFFVIFSAVLFFVAQMFVEKSFRVFKRRTAVECAGCVAVFLVCAAMLQFDIFGIESYVPQTEEIQAASLFGHGSVYFEDEADVEKVRALHQLILDHSGEQKAQTQATDGYMAQAGYFTDEADLADADNVQFYDYINITYDLKNGKSVSRAYQIMTYDAAFREELMSQCKGLFDDPEALKRGYFGANYEKLDWQLTGASVDCPQPTDQAGEYVYESCPVYGSKEEMQTLFDALLADFDAGAFDEYGWNGETRISTTLYLTLMTDHRQEEIRFGSRGSYGSYFDGEEFAGGTRMHAYLQLTDRCTNTVDALIRLGVIESADDLRVPEGDG